MLTQSCLRGPETQQATYKALGEATMETHRFLDGDIVKCRCGQRMAIFGIFGTPKVECPHCKVEMQGPSIYHRIACSSTLLLVNGTPKEIVDALFSAREWTHNGVSGFIGA